MWWWIGISVTFVVAVILLVVGPFVADRYYIADPSGTDVVTAVTAYRATREGDKWQYDDVWNSWRTSGPDCTYMGAKLSPTHRKAYLVDLGILARRNQFEPMFPVLQEQDYDIYTLDYTRGLLYDRQRSATWVAAFVLQLLDTYDEVVYDGISHGGDHAFYVAEALGDENVNKLSRVILHDPPSGVRTMKQMLNFAAGLFQFTAGTTVNGVLGIVLKLMLMAGTPKRENVSLPGPRYLKALGLPADMSKEDYFAYVWDQAKVNLSGHKSSLWYSELGDMVRTGREIDRGEFPFDAFGNVPVVMIRYVDKNGTVLQPAASEVFAANMPNLAVLEISGTHAGFLENYEDNTAVLYEALTMDVQHA